jgi:hypothetical protein
VPEPRLAPPPAPAVVYGRRFGVAISGDACAGGRALGRSGRNATRRRGARRRRRARACGSGEWRGDATDGKRGMYNFFFLGLRGMYNCPTQLVRW